MRVLIVGAAGNLGRRLVPALIVHGHSVTVLVRSLSTFREKLSASLFKILKEHHAIVEGDALDSDFIKAVILAHRCNAVVNTAGTRQAAGSPPTIPRIVASIAKAAIDVSELTSSPPIRAWFIGGLGSLQVTVGNSFRRLEEFMPVEMTEHHTGTVRLLEGIDLHRLQWSVLCVSWMVSAAPNDRISPLFSPTSHALISAIDHPPRWNDDWSSGEGPTWQMIQLLAQSQYATKLEEVADLIAEDLAAASSPERYGSLVGIKEA